MLTPFNAITREPHPTPSFHFPHFTHNTIVSIVNQIKNVRKLVKKLEKKTKLRKEINFRVFIFG